ncbi:hypothetical protein FRX31_018578 [Thalictrum thalictroides]|nr:hypothetical protein FRX31_018578 [Thalictrum thalictroides]
MEGLPWFNGPVNAHDSLGMQKDMEFNGNEGFYEDDFFNEKMNLLFCEAQADVPVESPKHYRIGALNRITPVDDTRNSVETGVKIRTRLPQYQSSSQNLVSQGTASRRIRLQKRLIRRVSFKGKELSNPAKDPDVKPTLLKKVAQADFDIVTVPPLASALASEVGDEISDEFKTNLRLRTRSRCDVIDSDQQDSSLNVKEATSVNPFSYLRLYMVSVAVIVIFVVFFVGAWQCIAT